MPFHVPVSDHRPLERLAQALDATDVGAWDLDLRSGTIVCNAAHHRICGTTPGAYPDHVDAGFAYVVPEDRPRLAAAMAEAEAVCGTYHAEFRLRRVSDGVVRHLRVRGAFFPDDAGRAVRASGTLRDVTDTWEQEDALLRAQAALRASEERFALVLEATEDGLWDWDVVTGAVYRSPRFGQMLGFAPEEIAPSVSAWERLVHPDDLPDVLALLDEHLSGRLPHFESEHRMRRRDGGWTWVLDRGKVVARDADGRPLRMVGAHTDVSARKAAESALAGAERRFRTLSASCPVGIFETDVAGQTTYVNARMCQLWARPESALRGLGWTTHVHPDDRAGVTETWAAAMREGREYAREYRVCLPDGTVRWVHGRAAPLRDAAGACVGAVGTVEDVTERMELETQLRHAQKMEAVGKLAGGVAHDFNNLLTVIRGNVEFVRRALPAASPMYADLVEVDRAVTRAAALVRDLLAFGRRQVLRAREVSLNAVVADAERLLRRVLGPEVVVAVTLDSALPPVWADAGQLEQVLLNLVLNARDAMPAGGTLSIETAVDTDAAAPRVRLTVRDTGAGMDADTQARVFEPFFTTKPAGVGTGLGLATVYGIVAQSGGELRVESAPGVGSTFHVLLPRAVDAR